MNMKVAIILGTVSAVFAFFLLTVQIGYDQSPDSRISQKLNKTRFTTYIWHINNFLTHLYCCYEKIGIIFIVFAIIIASSIIITLRVVNDIN